MPTGSQNKTCRRADARLSESDNVRPITATTYFCIPVTNRLSPAGNCERRPPICQVLLPAEGVRLRDRRSVWPHESHARKAARLRPARADLLRPIERVWAQKFDVHTALQSHRAVDRSGGAWHRACPPF